MSLHDVCFVALHLTLMSYKAFFLFQGRTKAISMLIMEAGYEQCLRPASCVCVLRSAFCVMLGVKMLGVPLSAWKC